MGDSTTGEKEQGLDDSSTQHVRWTRGSAKHALHPLEFATTRSASVVLLAGTSRRALFLVILLVSTNTFDPLFQPISKRVPLGIILSLRLHDALHHARLVHKFDRDHKLTAPEQLPLLSCGPLPVESDRSAFLNNFCQKICFAKSSHLKQVKPQATLLVVLMPLKLQPFDSALTGIREKRQSFTSDRKTRESFSVRV